MVCDNKKSVFSKRKTLNKHILVIQKFTEFKLFFSGNPLSPLSPLFIIFFKFSQIQTLLLFVFCIAHKADIRPVRRAIGVLDIYSHIVPIKIWFITNCTTNTIFCFHSFGYLIIAWPMETPHKLLRRKACLIFLIPTLTMAVNCIFSFIKKAVFPLFVCSLCQHTKFANFLAMAFTRFPLSSPEKILFLRGPATFAARYSFFFHSLFIPINKKGDSHPEPIAQPWLLSPPPTLIIKHLSRSNNGAR